MAGHRRTFLALRTRMMMLGVTQEELGKKLLLTRAAINAKFQLRAAWTLEECYAVMDYLGISTDDFAKYFPARGGYSEVGDV